MEAKFLKPLNSGELERMKKLVAEYRPSMDKTVLQAWGEDITKLLRSYLIRVGEM